MILTGIAICWWEYRLSVGLKCGLGGLCNSADIKGNEIRLQEAPEDCGYTVKKDNSGDVMLNLPFTSCHMTIQVSNDLGLILGFFFPPFKSLL